MSWYINGCVVAGSDLEGTATATIALRSTITSQYGNTLRADDGLNSEK